MTVPHDINTTEEALGRSTAWELISFSALDVFNPPGKLIFLGFSYVFNFTAKLQ